ncbi:hypothetical protein GIB67_005984 [Kingdonia uniflora]|uniref:Uncharacterized protein n=1 Tax=Kingdonia uniflora TaxID=39325 RepID=A0A7J7MC14_9MAGN|nr:hypothetical protein GIB67_005984 [Kingdonia uniflora]
MINSDSKHVIVIVQDKSPTSWQCRRLKNSICKSKSKLECCRSEHLFKEANGGANFLAAFQPVIGGSWLGSEEHRLAFNKVFTRFSHGHKNIVLCVKWNQIGNWVLIASKDQIIKVTRTNLPPTETLPPIYDDYPKVVDVTKPTEIGIEKVACLKSLNNVIIDDLQVKETSHMLNQALRNRTFTQDCEFSPYNYWDKPPIFGEYPDDVIQKEFVDPFWEGFIASFEKQIIIFSSVLGVDRRKDVGDNMVSPLLGTTVNFTVEYKV